MNNEKGTISQSRVIDRDRRFPVIEISRSDLELFFPKELISRLSDDDMTSIAARYGDRMWCEDHADDLREVAAKFIDQLD